MAKQTFKSLMVDGYGQLELNQVAFRRDGRVEAQCALDPIDFATIPAENGMILVVDKVNKKVRLPKADDTNVLYALHYSSEHMYDERARGLKDFKLTLNDPYPRMGFPSVSDRWTTNTIIYDTEDYADHDAIKAGVAAGTVFGVPSVDGYVALTDDPGDFSLVLQATDFTTMPDGRPAIKFVVIKA